ncbi:MAG: hypothetical protein Q8S03_12740 [Brevundimonas sp.]|uniref:hypothetical protein n=1 Tax=Brevundimonas sp. TaxID=1871086 RepID=UPI0027364BB2|nr:hypothetical protein [Brevundimonas sp.]MDP3405554.1 hypothetical protein [Brevundimonas sp.]
MPTITGTAGADTLRGGEGADTIDAGAGDDLVYIGSASTTGDIVLGGEGDDRFLWVRGEGFDFTVIDGGPGRDTLDYTGHEGGYYFRSRSLTLRDGSEPNRIEGWVDGYNGLFSPPLQQTFLNATSIERIIGSDISIQLDGFTQPLEIVSLGGGQIWTGSGNDTIELYERVRALYGGGEFRTLYSSEIRAGGGIDTLKLQGGVGDYLFQKTATGWSIHDGRSAVHQVSDVELLTFAGGTPMTFEAAAALDFDAEGYLARYADLRAVFGTDLGKAYQHYEAWGQAEGRIGSFDALSYIASYGDLIRAFGTDAATGTAHYASNGQAEGRIISFNPADYAASHLDLARVFGTDAARAASHYITSGVNEGRATGGFDSVAYLLSHSDLAGKTPSEARTHWLTSGADEGRVGDALFGRDQTDVTFSGGLEAGRFETATDRDWFAITLPVYETLTFNGSAGVTGLALYNATGKLIAADADGRHFQVVITNNDGAYGPAGYYLVVSGGSVGDYTVSYGASRIGATAEAEAAMQSAAVKQAVAAPEPMSPAPVDDGALTGPWVMPAGDPDLFMA